MTKKIQNMQHPGVYTFSADEASTPLFINELLKLKESGHAVTADITIDSRRKVHDTRVFHYLTCNHRECAGKIPVVNL